MADVIALQKGFNATVDDAINRSVESLPDRKDGDLYGLAQASLFFAGGVAGWADTMPPWGHLPRQRDALLRQFMDLEPVACASFASICGRNGAYEWKLNGGPRATSYYHEILESANFGRGWSDYVQQVCWDWLTQDCGAFTEIIRREDNDTSPVVGIQSLDAQYCFSTDDPRVPVIYYDRKSGRFKEMEWYQVHHMRDMPAHHPVYRSLQRSAVTRALKAVQIWRNIETYTEEKTGGRFPRAIHIINGVQRVWLEDAIKQLALSMNEKGFTRWSMPAIMTTVGADTKAEVATLELASLPDGFDKKIEFQQYITILAMALQTDYQELAPLESGSLGNSQQSETLDQKSKKKGAANFRRHVAAMVNNAITPATVELEWDETDVGEEQEIANAQKARAEARGAMIRNGEIDPAGARWMAFEAGDISEELFLAMNGRDLTLGGGQQAGQKPVPGGKQPFPIPAAPSTAQLASPGNPFQAAPPNPPPGAMTVVRREQMSLAERLGAEEEAGRRIERLAKGQSTWAFPENPLEKGPDAERLAAENEAAEVIHAALRRSYRQLREALKDEDTVKEQKPARVTKVVVRDSAGRIVRVEETTH